MELSENAIEARKAYQRDWRKLNKENRNAYLRDWRKRNKEKRNDYQRDWRKRNKSKIKQYHVDYWERKAIELELDTDKLSVTNKRNISVTSNLSVTCLNCGESFTPKRSDAKFCNTSCRVAFNRKNKKEFTNN